RHGTRALLDEEAPVDDEVRELKNVADEVWQIIGDAAVQIPVARPGVRSGGARELDGRGHHAGYAERATGHLVEVARERIALRSAGTVEPVRDLVRRVTERLVGESDGNCDLLQRARKNGSRFRSRSPHRRGVRLKNRA